MNLRNGKGPFRNKKRTSRLESRWNNTSMKGQFHKYSEFLFRGKVAKIHLSWKIEEQVPLWNEKKNCCKKRNRARIDTLIIWFFFLLFLEPYASKGAYTVPSCPGGYQYNLRGRSLLHSTFHSDGGDKKTFHIP